MNHDQTAHQATVSAPTHARADEATPAGPATPMQSATATPTDTANPTSATSSPTLVQETRSITYIYDGLNRLIGAEEQPGTVGYGYDAVGNRTEVCVDGSVTESRSYNAANQVDGWAYDAAGSPTSDGTTTYVYDALNRLTTQGSTTNTYTGDGTLVAQTTGDTTTRFPSILPRH